MRTTALLAALVAGALLVPASAPDARACGGCFHPPPLPMETGTVVTDHQMLFVVTPAQTTLYDMIKYSGSPSSFAWVLPIRGTATVGLSSDTVFAALDQVTKPVFIPPVLPPCPVPSNCPACNDFALGGAAATNGGSSSGGSSGGPPPVTVLSQATVGPYDTVQLQSTDPNALNNWLTTNGYNIPTDVQPIIAAYVADGFDFLALRLSPGQGVQAMRPVSVTTPGAGMTLPLRMVAAGTGATVGVTLWVLASGRYEPAPGHFSSFTIAPSDLTFDWNTYMDDYATVDAQKEAAMGNAAWLTESSMDIDPYTVENLVIGTGNGFGGSSSGVNPTTEGYTGSDAGDAAVTALQERSNDLQTLFPGGGSSVRVTRLRADLSHAALANDLVLQASADQGTLSNQYAITKSVNAPVCPNPPVCPCGGSLLNGGGNNSTPTASGSGSGGGGGGSGATTTTTTAGGSGCSTSSSEPGGSGVEFLLVGIAGAMVYGSRSRRRRR